MRVSVLLAALSAAGPAAAAPERYYGLSTDDQAALTLAGIVDGTTWTLRDLDLGTEIGSGELDRFAAATIDLGTTRHFALETSAAVLAYLGRDCCGVGGTTFLPTAQGHARSGRSFLLYLPLLRPDALRVFAAEDADITIQASTGAVIVERRINLGDVWRAWGLSAATPYVLRATGDVVVQLNAPNGAESVPPLLRSSSCDQDVGNAFLLATHSWATGSIALFSYEEADVVVMRVGELDPTYSRSLGRFDFDYRDGLGLDDWFVVALGGRVAAWTGDTEGGEGIAWMGDDVTQNVGDRGREIVAHTQTHGATVFSASAGTVVDVDGVETTLGADGFLDLEPDRLVHVTASAPVLLQTSGGNEMNDWGTFLRPVPAPDGPFDCPDLAIDIPVPEDGGVPPADAGADAATDVAAVDSGSDAPSSEPDAASPPSLVARGGGCACGVAPPGLQGWWFAAAGCIVIVLAGSARQRRRRLARSHRGVFQRHGRKDVRSRDVGGP